MPCLSFASAASQFQAILGFTAVLALHGLPSYGASVIMNIVSKHDSYGTSWTPSVLLVISIAS